MTTFRTTHRHHDFRGRHPAFCLRGVLCDCYGGGPQSNRETAVTMLHQDGLIWAHDVDMISGPSLTILVCRGTRYQQRLGTTRAILKGKTIKRKRPNAQQKRTFTGTLSASWPLDLFNFKGWRLAAVGTPSFRAVLNKKKPRFLRTALGMTESSHINLFHDTTKAFALCSICGHRAPHFVLSWYPHHWQGAAERWFSKSGWLGTWGSTPLCNSYAKAPN